VIRVDLCAVHPEQPHDLVVEIPVGLPDHAGRILAPANEPVVVVAHEKRRRLVFVDQVHARVNVGQHIVGPLFIARTLPEPSKVPSVAEVYPDRGAKVGDEVEDERPCFPVQLIAVRVRNGYPSLGGHSVGSGAWKIPQTFWVDYTLGMVL